MSEEQKDIIQRTRLRIRMNHGRAEVLLNGEFIVSCPIREAAMSWIHAYYMGMGLNDYEAEVLSEHIYEIDT